MIADHNAILATFDLHIPSSPAISRYGWCYKKADWGSLRYELEHADWSFVFTTPLDNAVCKLEQKILDSCLRHIPRRQFMDRKQEHPWLNDACRQAIRNKHIHEHDSDYSMYCNRCSEVLLSEYHKYIAKIRTEMQALPRGSKKWWKMNSILLHRKSKSCSIPALRDESGTWILDAQSKANLFADVWSSKFSLPASVDDSWVISASTNSYLQHVNIRSRHALKILKTLDVSKATGPDGIPARVLRNVASEIAWVVKVIARSLSRRSLARKMASSPFSTNLQKICCSSGH